MEGLLLIYLVSWIGCWGFAAVYMHDGNENAILFAGCGPCPVINTIAACIALSKL